LHFAHFTFEFLFEKCLFFLTKICPRQGIERSF
jgi:hypothetical protein